MGSFFKKVSNIVVLSTVGLMVLVSGASFAISGIKYAAYEKEYNKNAEALQATFPALPDEVVIDNEYVKYDDEGANVVKTKSKFKKSFTYYARDAVVAPLSQDVAAEYGKIDDSYLGEYITGLDRKGGAISFYIRTPDYGKSDIDIVLATNWVDEKGQYHGLDNITDFIKVQINKLEVKTVDLSLPEDGSYQHLILKNTHLLKGENILTLTTSAYNTYGNKDDVLYVMPNIKNVTVLTNVNVYTPEYDIDTSSFKTTYRLVDMPNLSTITCKKKIGDPNTSCYEEEEIDGSKLNASIDYANSKVLIKCSPTDVKEIPITLDTSAANNTITGEIDGKQATIVVNSQNQITATVDGKEVVAKVELTGKGLARINVLEKVSGDDAAFNALPKKISIEEVDGNLNIALVKYYMSTTKANTGTGGTTGPSQTGNTYFAISCDEYLTAFWNWTWNGDECLTLKCTYTMSGNKITLTNCQAYSRDEWQYLSNKSFTVTEISAAEVPENLSSRLTLY